MEAPKLADRFSIPNRLGFEQGPAGLVRAVISTPAAEAELNLQGAHITRWTPRGQRPVLFLSPKSLFAPGKAIRGGVPVIFPWFGDRKGGLPGPAHGFARTTTWDVEGTELLDGGNVEITLGLTSLALASGAVTRSFFDSAFQLRYRVTVGPELKLELTARNEGNEAFTFEEALHSYFAVGDVHEASVSGLEGTTFLDKTDLDETGGFKRKQLGSEPFRIAKETDYVFVNTKATCVIHDPVWNRRIVVAKSGSDSTVVWNPWIGKTMGMHDMDADGWKGMLCIETANAADNAVRLSPGESHTLAAVIRVE